MCIPFAYHSDFMLFLPISLREWSQRIESTLERTKNYLRWQYDTYSCHSSIHTLSELLVDAFIFQIHAAQNGVAHVVLCLRDPYNFNCLRVSFLAWFSLNKKPTRPTVTWKERKLYKVNRIYDARKGATFKATICCLLHISSIFEHFRNHFISAGVVVFNGQHFMSVSL